MRRVQEVASRAGGGADAIYTAGLISNSQYSNFSSDMQSGADSGDLAGAFQANAGGIMDQSGQTLLAGDVITVLKLYDSVLGY